MTEKEKIEQEIELMQKYDETMRQNGWTNIGKLPSNIDNNYNDNHHLAELENIYIENRQFSNPIQINNDQFIIATVIYYTDYNQSNYKVSKNIQVFGHII